MVTINYPTADDEFELEIILIPHRAMEWRDNKRVIALLGSVCIAIALGYGVVFGTWIILPFAGLEVLALGIGLYYASWKLNYRHIVRITSDHVVVEKGVYKPRKRWQLKRSESRLAVAPAKHDWEAKKLSLQARQEHVDIGGFLDKADVQEVIDIVSPSIPVKYAG